MKPCANTQATALLLAMLGIGGVHAASSVVLDGSLKAGTAGTALTPSGTFAKNWTSYNKITIPETVGKRVGGNVFQSFSSFGLAAGDAAVFTLNAPANNIISRVTGGQASAINGMMSVDPGGTGSRPNFFFINPAGVTFGAGAAIDMPAAFHVSTANYLKFPDGKFYADPASGSTFSSAAPEAFGFLGSTPARIAVDGGAALMTQMAPFSIVAGDVKVEGANTTVTTMGGGDMRVVANGATAQEVPVTGPLPAAQGDFTILNGAKVGSTTTPFIPGNAGDVAVSSGTLTADGGGTLTGVGSWSVQGSSGNAGAVSVNVADRLTLVNSGGIATNTDSSGSAGLISVKAGSLALTNGGIITSLTSASGKAGSIEVSAGDISIDNNNNMIGITSEALYTASNDSGNVTVSTPGRLFVRNGTISSASFTQQKGNAGNISISAGSMWLDNAGLGSIAGYAPNQPTPNSSANAGNIELIVQGNIDMTGHAIIDSSTGTRGNGGNVRVSARDINIRSGGILSQSITENVDATLGPNGPQAWSTGNAGSIEVNASGSLNLVADPGKMVAISSSTNQPGSAGSIKVTANNITIDTQGYADNMAVIVSMSVPTFNQVVNGPIPSYGSAGSVDVTAHGTLSVLNNGAISSNATAATGSAGAVKVAADTLRLSGNGNIASDTYGAGRAGTVQVSANRLSIDAGSFTPAPPSPATTSEVPTDYVTYLANQIGGGARISSQSRTGATGDAGSINVNVAQDLQLLNGGRITSSTSSAGRAGAVSVSAASLLLDGGSNLGGSSIAAAALAGSSGETGDVTVTAADSLTLSNGGLISIGNDARVASPPAIVPTFIIVTAPRVTIRNSPNAITTSSTGNVAAGSITIGARDWLDLDPSGITTTSQDGDGGAIAIRTGMLRLDNSQIATSVKGLAGNGGNISIRADTLLLNTGFIQANTAAANASGGTVSIAARNLVSSGDTLLLGGSTPYAFQPGVFGFNVIQAAAPTGVSGAVRTSTPSLDISSTLVGLTAKMVDAGGIGRSPCRIGGGSSLVQTGRGGFAASARGLFDPVLPATAQTAAAPPPAPRLAAGGKPCAS